ncbi:hypothetical protein ABFS83_09G087600 [Erythranthe nasuta]
MDRVSCLMIYGAIFGILLTCALSQNVHVVGDGMGWIVPPNGPLSYSNWASGKTFMVGDILVFNFATNEHDVLRVPRASYDACTQDNGIGGVITAGPANITIDSNGDHYYICTFGRHCLFGQKLAITVGPPPSTPGGAMPPVMAPPAGPTTPSPASSEPDACAPTPYSPPIGGGPNSRATPPSGPAPPDSASTSLANNILVVLLSAFIIAFLF